MKRWARSSRVKWSAELHERAMSSIRAAACWAQQGDSEGEAGRRRSLLVAAEHAEQWAESLIAAANEPPQARTERAAKTRTPS